MSMIYLSFVIIAVSTIILYRFARSFTAPGVLAGIEWSVIYLLLFNTTLFVDQKSWIYLYVAFAVAAFQWISYVTGGKGSVKYNNIDKLEIKYLNIYIILAILALDFAYYLSKIIRILISSDFTPLTIVYTLKYAQLQGWLQTGLTPYFATFSFMLSSLLIAIYILQKKDGNASRELKRSLNVSILLSLGFSLSLMGRVYMLDFVSGVIFTLIFTTDTNNKKLKNIIIILAVVLATVFFAYGVSKFYYRLNEMSLKQILDDTISVYVAGPLVGMQILLKNGVPAQEPKATLSFFYRLFNAFGANMPEYIRIDKLMLGPAPSLNGNVFTVFYYLIIDYGYIAAFVIFCVFGAIHGLLYRAASKNGDGFFTLILIFMYYPLLMQFFDEQYLTQISKFIQIVFWSFVLFKTPLTFRKNPEANRD